MDQPVILTPGADEMMLYLPLNSQRLHVVKPMGDKDFQVFDGERLLATLSPGEEASFKAEPPRWWQPWIIFPRWARINNQRA